MSKNLKIFEGLSLPMEAIRELACYWNVADDDVGIIDSKGKMTTSNDIWDRPCASRSYEILRKALESCSVSWITLGENTITVDFRELRYNHTWLKRMFQNRDLGVCNSEVGLKLFQKKETYGKAWFEDLYWTLRGVTVESLGLEKNEVVSLTPNSENPDEAEWKKLYFAA